MVKGRAVSILCCIFWGGLVYLGITVCVGAASQEVAGYPNIGRLEFYILFPLAMALLSACLTIFVKKLPKSLYLIFSFLLLALIPSYLFFYGGGI